MTSPLRLLAIAASMRSDSLNRKLLKFAISEAEKSGAQVTQMDYAQCAAPIYYGDNTPEFPAGVQRLSAMLKAHDGLILASPEYNWSIPGHLKNLIDWLSVDPAAPLQGRQALLMCASPSPRGGILGLNQLGLPLAHLGMYVYPHLIAIGNAEEQLGSDGISATKDRQFFIQCVTDFVRVTRGMKG